MIDLSRFGNVALQFSGGKDSLACLFLLRDQIERISVYWLNTGDSCPETVEVIDSVRKWVPKFIEVTTDAKQWRSVNGDPSDIVPSCAHTLGVAYGMSDRRIVSKFDCCYFNLMLPMHNRMLQDGIDAVVRGTKLCDTGTVPHEGPTGDYEVILPIRNWSHEDVFSYLNAVHAPINSLYQNTKGASAPECFSCTAWWDDGKAAYLRAKYPEQHAVYTANLNVVRSLLRGHLADLDNELRS